MRAQRWEQLADLFAELTTLAPQRRESFIRDTCGNDIELREELLSLLRAHDAGCGPLDAAPVLSSDDTDASEPIELGMTVGPYRLVRPLGEGGMGSVWLAERVDGVLKRTVALKRPHVAWVGTLAERMARERDILAGLEHPGIARLYDAGVASDGRPFLALEYVDGVPVTEYCDSKHLPIRRRLELFLQVLDAVSYAHTHLVIHRDIKPSNILVSADGRVHLLDFGIAKLLDHGVPEASHTQWAPAATPDYASPEQISGHAISTASDVYSLGVLLSELLTGSRPHELKRQSRRALEDAILEVEPTAPSRSVQPEAAHARGTSPAALTRELCGDLDSIVLKALRKDPADRYTTVDFLAHDIVRHLRGEAIHAHPGSAWYHARKFIQRHKLAVAAATAVVVALVSGAGVALWQAHEARLEAARAEQVKNFALSMLECADTDAGAGAGTTAVELLQAARERVESELAGRPAIAAELMTAIGYGLIGQDRAADAVPLLERAIELSSQANGPGDARTLAAQVIYGEALYKLAKIDAAIALLKPAAEHARLLRDRHTEIDAWRWLSSAQIDAGAADAGVASARSAVAALSSTPPSGRRELLDAIQAHMALANALNSMRSPGVVEEARTTLQLVKQWPGARPPPAAVEARVLLGVGLVREGQVATGLRELKAAYSDARTRFGDGHRQVEIIANMLGTACMEAGDAAGAVAAYQASFDSAMRRPAERGPFDLGIAHYGLAVALHAAGELQRALPHFAEAARLFAEANGATAPLALRSRSARALTLTRLGRLDEAEREFASLATMPFAGADKARHDGRLAVLRSLQGRHDEAVPLASASVEGLKAFPSKTIEAQNLASFGVVLLAAGQPERAIPPLERSIELYREAQPEESPDRAEAIAALDRARRANRQ